jgi:hypothetical protein
MNILNRVKGLAQNVAGTAIGEAKAVLTGGRTGRGTLTLAEPLH